MKVLQHVAAHLPMADVDAPMQVRFELARRSGRGLRYLARLDQAGVARVSLEMPENGHASLHSRLTGTLRMQGGGRGK